MRTFEWILHAGPVPNHIVKKILDIVLASDDPKILEGAFIALSSSPFLELAGTDVLLKMLRAIVNRDAFVGDLFNRSRRNPAREGELEILLAVARQIVFEPDRYSFKVTTSASDYLAERLSVSVPPLLLEEQTLGIASDR
jgi:hypothetical protein